MRIGRYWDKAQEIDICDVSEDGSAFLWGECRWRRTKMSAEDLKQLRDKVVASGVGRGSKSTFLLCSKSGFTKDLEKRAKDEGVILWDAEKLDKLSGQTSRRQHKGISLKECSLSRWLVLVCCSW